MLAARSLGRPEALVIDIDAGKEKARITEYACVEMETRGVEGNENKQVLLTEIVLRRLLIVQIVRVVVMISVWLCFCL